MTSLAEVLERWYLPSFNEKETTTVDGLFLAGVARLPLSTQVGFLAKAGLLSWDRERDYNLSRIEGRDPVLELASSTISDSGTDPFIGIGIQFGWFDLSILRTIRCRRS